MKIQRTWAAKKGKFSGTDEVLKVERSRLWADSSNEDAIVINIYNNTKNLDNRPKFCKVL